MKTLLLSAALLGLAISAQADDIVNISINTSTLSGTTGYLDFQFNPSPAGSQAATVQIQNFMGAAYVAGSQAQDGAASGGPLPAKVTINNSSAFAFNDDFEGFTLGKQITFTLDFSGPAVSMPSGSGSPSTFTLFATSDVNGLNPILTSNASGILATINISPDTGLAIGQSTTSNLQFVPEPGSIALLGSGLVGLFVWSRRRRS